MRPIHLEGPWLLGDSCFRSPLRSLSGALAPGSRDGLVASAALQQACTDATVASDGDLPRDDGSDDDAGDHGEHHGYDAAHGHSGNGNGQGPSLGSSVLLARLASSDDFWRDTAALQILRKGRDYGDPVVTLAASAAGNLADWRADRPLVWILRNRFPASNRVFSSSTRANAALALGAIAQFPRGEPLHEGGHGGHHGHLRSHGQDGGGGGDAGGDAEATDHGTETGHEAPDHSAIPAYVLHAVAVASCPPENPDVRNAAVRALGEMRDDEAVPLLQAILGSPTTGDEVQDRLLAFTASRALTMIQDSNATTSEVTLRTHNALEALKQALPSQEVTP